jgi:hypothetical protein
MALQDFSQCVLLFFLCLFQNLFSLQIPPIYISHINVATYDINHHARSDTYQVATYDINHHARSDTYQVATYVL